MRQAGDRLGRVGRWPLTHVYLKSPVVYLAYFDEGGVMRDSSCLSN